MSPNTAEPSRGHEPAPDAGLNQPWEERRFGLLLAVICLVGLICRCVILVDYVTGNALAGTPLVDAGTYWDWAGRVAGGQLVQDVPFFSAPLYPYLLGLLRAVGGTLTSVYVVQMMLDLVTAGVLGCVARGRFGARAGLLSAVLFLLLQEPASFSLRVLTCTLQLLLLAVVYGRLVAVQKRPTVSRRLALGVALGLLCLSYPPAMLLALASVPWLFWQSSRGLRDAPRALIPLGVAALLIAPATLHNWHASGGDVFLIQSVPAVNLRQGNQSASEGVYTPIPETSTGREHLFDDVARQYTLATGKPAHWGDINRYYRAQVFEFWRADPLRALRLVGLKLYYFVSSRNYGDIYQPNSEIAYGLNRWLRLTPIPLPWLIWPALVGLVWLLRHPIRHGPEWLMLAVPLAVVVVFWYCPRYRLPAIPVVVVMAAWAIERAVHWRARPGRTAAVVVALAAGVLLGPVNRAIGFDLRDPTNAPYNLACALQEQGNVRAAVEKVREGLELNPDDVPRRIGLGNLLVELERFDEALVEYERARLLSPEDPQLLARIGDVLVRLGRWQDARAAYEHVALAYPDDPDVHRKLGVIAAQLGDLDAAETHFERALQIAPDSESCRRLLERVREQRGKRAPARP